MTSYLFRARTQEGFILKILAEYISNVLKYPPFHVDAKGITLRATDQNRESLLDLDLSRENFTAYKCTRPLTFMVNSAHFYRLVKSIKKKDAVTMFIDEHNPLQLGICVEQNEETSDRVTTFINITYVQAETIDLPEQADYRPAIVVTSKHFQKLKALYNIGTELKITIVGQIIKFYVNGKNLFSREISIGEKEDESGAEEYMQTFNTILITQLTKCAGQSGNIQIFHHPDLPLQLKMRTGTLGTLTMYIKSKELYDQEDETAEEVSTLMTKDNESEEIEDEEDDNEETPEDE